MTFIFSFVRNILNLLGLFEVASSIFGPVFMSVDSPLNQRILLVKKLYYNILFCDRCSPTHLTVLRDQYHFGKVTACSWHRHSARNWLTLNISVKKASGGCVLCIRWQSSTSSSAPPACIVLLPLFKSCLPWRHLYDLLHCASLAWPGLASRENKK